MNNLNTFSVPITKGVDNGKSITYKIKFIDSFRFMSSSLSSFVDNLSEGLYSDKCTDCKSCLDYMITKDDQLIFRCFECKKNYRKDFNKELIKRFANIYELCNEDINKFVSLLRKGVYPYEYMDSWERFDETSLPDKETFYSCLNMEGITNVGHKHAKRVFKESNNKNLGDYHVCVFKVIHYCVLMHLRILETNVLKYINWILLIFYLHLDSHGKLV